MVNVGLSRAAAELATMLSSEPDVSRVLIVRLGALGDIVHALPVLGALQHHWPWVQVDWLVDGRYAGVLEYVEGIKRTLVVRAEYSGDDGRVVKFGHRRGLLGACRYMRQQRYDVALDLQGLLKSASLARLSGAHRVIGFGAPRLREPQAAWFYTETAPAPADAHVIAKNLSMLPALGIDDDAGWRFPLRVPRSGLAERAIASVAAHGSRYALINVGGGWPNKRWPPVRFGELAARLWADCRLPSFVLWGRGEEKLADAVVKHALGAASGLPATTLGDLLALAARATVMVSGDTGPLHLATALGTPVVGLYGPTWPSRNGPFRRDDQTVSRANSCQCHHKRECSRSTPCLDEIGVDEVFRATVARIAQASPR